MTTPSPELGTDWIVMADAGGTVPRLNDFALVAKAVRDLFMARWEGPIPEMVSGHAPDGRPSKRPHLAILPLAFVGPALSDGRLMGLAIALPRLDLSEDAVPVRNDVRRRILAIVASGGGPLEVLLGTRGVWSVELRDAPHGFSLNPSRYLEPARRWASITPIVLDRYPKADIAKAAIVAESGARIGLPRPCPAGLRLNRASAVAGAPPTQTADSPWGTGGWSLPPRRDGSRHPFEDRLSTHAVFHFPEPVPGPVVLGAGRFMGLGLCLALPDVTSEGERRACR